MAIDQYGASDMGYEARILIGTVGSTPSAQFKNVVDLEYNLDQEMGDTSTRGGGDSVPIATEKTTALKPEITFKSLSRASDTILAALLAAGSTGAAMGVRYKNAASGKGYDGDMNVKWKNGAPLKGEQTFEFTLTANDQLRNPAVWS
jgi:hypothetical protein